MTERNISRRALFRGAAGLAGVAALGACTITTTNGVTTVTVNVKTVVSDVNVALGVAKTAMGFVGIPSTVVTVVDAGIATINGALSAFQNSAGDSLTLTFNSNSVPDALTSLIADMNVVAKNISATTSALSSDLASKVSSVASDVANVASILESLIAAVVSARIGMTADQAREMQILAIKARHGLV